MKSVPLTFDRASRMSPADPGTIPELAAVSMFHGAGFTPSLRASAILFEFWPISALANTGSLHMTAGTPRAKNSLGCQSTRNRRAWCNR